MNNDSGFHEGLALAVIALVLSLGLLRANELLAFFGGLDVFEFRNSVLHIRGRELVGVTAFTMLYVVLLIIVLFGVGSLLWGSRSALPEQQRVLLEVLISLVLVLSSLQFFALAVSYTHLMHKYGEAVRSAETIEWDWQN